MRGCEYGDHEYVDRHCVRCGAWESQAGGGLCRCGHFEGCHEPWVKCHGLRLVGPGNEYDGGDYAPCSCELFDQRVMS